MSSPVSQPDSSEARNTAIGAMSEGCPTRPGEAQVRLDGNLVSRSVGTYRKTIMPSMNMLF